MQSQQIMPAMSGFTADFFGALETTFTDNSLNNSKCQVSQQNPNRLQLIRELRQQSVVKIVQLATKLVKGIAYEEIYMLSLRKKRVANKTPINIHKTFYKIHLLFNLKNSAKLQWSFYRLHKFVEEYTMVDYMKKLQEKQQKQRGFEEAPVAPVQQDKVQMANQKIKIAVPAIPVSSIPIIEPKPIKNRELDTSKSIIKDPSLLCEVLCRLVTEKRELQLGMTRIREYEYYKTKKSYLLQIIVFLNKKIKRDAFLSIYSVPKKKLPVIQHISEQLIKDSTPQSKPTIDLNTKQAHNVDKHIKNAKEAYHSSTNCMGSEKKLTRPSSGLKFNRCFKKKNQPAESQQKRERTPGKISSSPLLKKKPSSNVEIKEANCIKIQKIKYHKIVTNLKETYLFIKVPFKDLTSLPKTYHLTQQEMKKEVPDIQDQMAIIQEKLSQSRSSSKQKILTFNRLHKLDNKKPLQFSNKKQKSRLSSSKSKKSVGKSEQQQPEAYNVQSMKSYYFPEDQKYGRAIVTPGEKPATTKYIGSENWVGQSKKRITTQVQIRYMRSNEKPNPYLEELREKMTKKQSQRVISLHKMIERSISARSNSKTSKASKQQRKAQLQQLIVINSQNNKNSKPRNMSPQTKLSNNEPIRIPQPGVPREWHFINTNASNITSPIRNADPKLATTKSALQFQKIVKHNQ